MVERLFGVDKPVIAMVHFPPLPGTPLYDEAAPPFDAVFECDIWMFELTFREAIA